MGNPKLDISFFGKTYSSPIVIAPMGHQTQFHKNGETETAKGAEKSSVLSFFGTQGRISLADIRKKKSKIKLWMGNFSIW